MKIITAADDDFQYYAILELRNDNIGIRYWKQPRYWKFSLDFKGMAFDLGPVTLYLGKY